MFLGIEVGGTKLQLGVGPGKAAELVDLRRFDVEPALGAAGIRERIRLATGEMIARHGIRRVGYGFGGPVNAARGCVVTSHQIEGWTNFPLAEWTRKTLGVPAVIGNDADLAGLAEARFGAGRGRNPVFYITVGTGVGGGLIVDGAVYGGQGKGAAEIGHLRPGLQAQRPDETIESITSGRGIASTVRACLNEAVQGKSADEGECAADLLRRCGGDPERISSKIVAEAAADGNLLALDVLDRAWQALGWGIAQAITLVSPSVVVIGGGVSLMGEKLFFGPLRAVVERYVFPPFRNTYEIVPAMLGEEMVVYGALALAADADNR
jgi:glucokinase